MRRRDRRGRAERSIWLVDVDDLAVLVSGRHKRNRLLRWRTRLPTALTARWRAGPTIPPTGRHTERKLRPQLTEVRTDGGLAYGCNVFDELALVLQLQLAGLGQVVSIKRTDLAASSLELATPGQNYGILPSKRD